MKSALAFLFLIVSYAGFSQNAFKILANKGKNEVKVGSSWQLIKVGGSIGKNDQIKIAPNSYLALVHASGKPLEVKEPGIHNVSDLEKKVANGPTVMTKYTDFILSSSSSPNNSLKATGAVHRGGQNINVYLPTVPVFKVVYGPQVMINWDETVKGPFVVTLSNTFGDELKKIETSEYSVNINLDDAEFKGQDNISVNVFSKPERKNSPEQLGFRTSTKAEKEKIHKALETELGAVAKEETALSKLILASFFEEQKLLIDAATAYQQAIKLAPDVQDYKDSYKAFLLRTSLKEP